MTRLGEGPVRVSGYLLDSCEEGLLSWERVARACIAYMSERDVDDMAHCEGLSPDDDDADGEEEDDHDEE